MRFLTYVLAALLCVGAAHATSITSWDGTYETGTFSDATIVNQLDDLLDQVLESIRGRAETELCWGTADADGCAAGGDTGRSREGNARAFYVTDCSAVSNLYAPDDNGSTALGAADNGRLCIDSDDGEVYYYVNPLWKPINPGFQGVAAKSATADAAITDGSTASIGFDSETDGYDVGAWHSTAATTCLSGSNAGCRFTVPSATSTITRARATCNYTATAGGTGTVQTLIHTSIANDYIAATLTHVVSGEDFGVNLTTPDLVVAAGTTIECVITNNSGANLTIGNGTSTWMSITEVH